MFYFQNGVALAFLSMLLNSFVIIILRRLRKVHWLLILVAFGILGVLENVIVAATLGVLELPVGIYDCLLAYGAFPTTVFSAEIFIMLALKFDEAGPVVLVGTSGVIFSFLLQFVFFGVPPDVYSLGGGTIVILGVMITTWRKWVEGLSPEDQRRKMFKYLLL